MNLVSNEQKLGYLVNFLRRRREAGARVRELLSLLESHRPVLSIRKHEYLATAFCSSSLHMLGMLAEEDASNESIWEMLEEVIDKELPAWVSQPFPELMRVRDYTAFLQFTKETRAIVTVCAASPLAGRWIGKPGMSCYGGRMFVPACQDEPNAGMLAADPSDRRLQVALHSYGPAMSYEEYVVHLEDEGVRVLGAKRGYLLEDRQGRRLHDGYRLHGLYCAKTYESLWSGKHGESLRAKLNLCLGQPLVALGPHDCWEHRNNRELAGPFYGPLTPVIEFADGKVIRNLLTPRAMADLPQYQAAWTELYPDHPIQ